MSDIMRSQVAVEGDPIYRTTVTHECGHRYRSECGWNDPAAAERHGHDLLKLACSTCRDAR